MNTQDRYPTYRQGQCNLDLQHGFVEVWNNGNRCIAVATQIYGIGGALSIALRYCREWAADTNPRYSPEVWHALNL